MSKASGARLQIYNIACCDPRTSKIDLKVLWRIIKHMFFEKLESCPSTETIALQIGTSRQRVSKAAKRLEAFGYIQVARTAGGLITNSYTLKTSNASKLPHLNKNWREASPNEIGAEGGFILKEEKRKKKRRIKTATPGKETHQKEPDDVSVLMHEDFSKNFPCLQEKKLEDDFENDFSEPEDVQQAKADFMARLADVMQEGGR